MKPMVQKRRLATTIVAAMMVEVANKIFPLIVIHFAQAQLGVAAFGFAQFGIHLVDFAIPFVVFGYHTAGSILIGTAKDASERIGAIIGWITGAKLINAVIAAIILQLCVHLIPEYHEFQTIITLLSFMLFTSAVDMYYVHVGTQRMLSLSVMSVIAKTISLVLILVFVRKPEDAILYAAISFGANAIVSLGTLWISAKRFPISPPSRRDLVQVFQMALPFGVTALLVMAAERFDMFVVEWKLGLVAAGLYAGALRVFRSLQPFVNMLSTVFFSEMVAVDNDESFYEHVRLSFWSSLAIAFPVGVGTWFVGGEILGLIVGPEYASLRTVFAILAASLVADSFLYVFGHQTLILKRHASWFNAALIVGVLLGWGLGAPAAALYGLVGVAVIVLIAKAIPALIVTLLARRFLPRWPMAEFMRVFLPTCGMAAVLLAMPQAHFLWKILAGGVSYGAFMAMTNRHLLRTIWSKIYARK